MSTALATMNGHALAAIPEGPPLTPATMEKVLLSGDLSGLSAGQRLEFYRARCDAAKLDPRAQPFEYLVFQGKMILYAKKTTADQLTGIHKLSVQITAKGLDRDAGIYTAEARVTFPSGRIVEDMGAVNVAGLKGEQLSNAMMKAISKAKRRAVLSACGLGMLDESEVETLQGAKRIILDDAGEIAGEVSVGPPPPQHDSGYGRGQYASPEQTKVFNDAVRGFIDRKNAEWLDRWTGPHGLITDDAGELMNGFQARGHLCKWAIETGQFDQSLTLEAIKGDNASKYLAIIYSRSQADRKALAK
jgi:hypothetical protein